MSEYSKKLRDYLILVSECETVRNVVLTAISMGRPKVCINIDSYAMINVIKGKIKSSKDIINFVEDIR